MPKQLLIAALTVSLGAAAFTWATNPADHKTIIFASLTLPGLMLMLFGFTQKKS